MAPAANISHLLNIVVILATFAIGTSTVKPSSQFAAAPSSAAEAFLHSRCGTTKYVSVCYNALLPFVNTFNGSQVKISSVATSVVFGKLRAFLVELQRLQAAGGTGTGSRGDQALGACVHDVGMGIDEETEAMPYLRVLETPGISKEKAKHALFNVQSSISGVASFSELCIEDFVDAGDVTLGSPVGKKVVAMTRNCNMYIDIALHLVASIKM
ncbi:unnamed protein product [Urochloa decumbens]|uniref:Pectinesterase inhibitor domain-containing protein n=1 Tax=Urochloa decumbens TaxID=240449 RepID=A0ABC8WYI1_9POAL